MTAAIAPSKGAMREGRGGPFGAVVVKDGAIIGQGINDGKTSRTSSHTKGLTTF